MNECLFCICSLSALLKYGEEAPGLVAGRLKYGGGSMIVTMTDVSLSVRKLDASVSSVLIESREKALSKRLQTLDAAHDHATEILP